MNQSGWFHSVGCCQGRSISPGPSRATGGLRDRGRRVLPHPQQFKDFFLSAVAPEKYCEERGACIRERKGLEHGSRGKDVGARDLTLILPLRGKDKLVFFLFVMARKVLKTVVDVLLLSPMLFLAGKMLGRTGKTPNWRLVFMIWLN